jgi:hypothetical protein
MGRIKPLFAASVAALVLAASGCATVTKGSNQAITLHTDPDGAMCDVTRESKPVTSLAATPGQVQVNRETASIDISCRKSGYQPSDLRVQSTVEAWTFGNILLGGIVGFAVDAASGAMRQYPQFITLTLVPEEFGSTDDRERYVKERLARFDREAALATVELKNRCGLEDCPNDHKALEAAKARRLEIFQERVNKARIRGPATAARPEGSRPPAAKSPGN